MKIKLKARLVFNMTTYGVALGGLAGALSAITLIMTSSAFKFMGGALPVMLLEVLSIGVFGMILGGIFGLMAGFYSGIGMAVLTRLFFQEIFSHTIFKATMALITILSTSLFFINSLWHLRIDGIEMTGWNSMIFMSVVISVYASQRVCDYYIHEWSLHKQKASA